eukprot:TRINITY_DN93053_c0_g1_i1.p1 TRINITY_DN93053_c0_g1~~TRINITY_DN93053_c0_g1_i1.p1  ORF type:complete len:456 (+),score=61.99 TRINITY_DN93053_c0_g1_i1:65-1432(+)
MFSCGCFQPLNSLRHKSFSFSSDRERTESSQQVAEPTLIPVTPSPRLPLPLDVGFAEVRLVASEEDGLLLRILANGEHDVTQEGTTALLNFLDFVLELDQASKPHSFTMAYDLSCGSIAHFDVISRLVSWTFEQGRQEKWKRQCKRWDIITANGVQYQYVYLRASELFWRIPPPCETRILTDHEHMSDLEGSVLFQSALQPQIEPEPAHARAQSDAEAVPDSVKSVLLAKLHERFDGVSSNELARFLQGAGEDLDAVSKRLEWMLSWRAEHPTEVILAAAEKVRPSGFLGVAGPATNGLPIIFVQPARYDPSMGSAEEFVMACVAAVDEVCPRDADGKVLLLMDLRPGTGWPNLGIWHLASFIRSVAHVFGNLFPERLSRAIAYPLPFWAATALSLVKSTLDPVTAGKILVMQGDDSEHSPPPSELAEWVAYEALPEEVRHRHKSLQVSGAHSSK